MQTVIRNIGQIVSGDIAAPLLDADTIGCADGKIAWVGRAVAVDDDTDATIIDAGGCSGTSPRASGRWISSNPS
jgi:enamidase